MRESGGLEHFSREDSQVYPGFYGYKASCHSEPMPSSSANIIFGGKSKRLSHQPTWCRAQRPFVKIKTKKNPAGRSLRGFSLITSLTITYFHTGCSTIIGEISFHGPVRDGKGWYRFSMVIRHNLYRRLLPTGQQGLESGRSIVLVRHIEGKSFVAQRLTLSPTFYGGVAICINNKRQRVALISAPAKVIGTSRTGN